MISDELEILKEVEAGCPMCGEVGLFTIKITDEYYRRYNTILDLISKTDETRGVIVLIFEGFCSCGVRYIRFFGWEQDELTRLDRKEKKELMRIIDKYANKGAE